ncbi:hypothetical protein GGR09_000562 [Bartonella heixiaziensis]
MSVHGAMNGVVHIGRKIFCAIVESAIMRSAIMESDR